MTWSIDEAAKRMGMPAHEVLAVAEVGDYHVITTHDGQHTLVTEDGQTEPYNGDPARLEDPRLAADAGEGEPSAPRPPEGTADEVLAWVGEDAERAAAALEAEQARAKPRSTLVAQLEKLAESA